MDASTDDIKLVEERNLMDAILAKKSFFKDDINAFLNSLSEEEFAAYMKFSEVNGEDLWNTGRENTLNVALEGEDRTDNNEQQALQQTIEEDILREQLELIEAKNNVNLTVFEGVPFNDFYQIFDIECFEKLPLFVKLFFLKEVMQYN